MWHCGSCSARFEEYGDYHCHLEDYAHWAECETCPKAFATLASCEQHMDSLNHWASTYDCHACDMTFWTQELADEHMECCDHWGPYCPDCDRWFQNETNLRAHLNSRIHRGTTVACPFCPNRFVSASGLSHHLETGSCPRAPQLNREKILRMVRQRDVHGSITNKKLTWHDEPSGIYYPTDQAWNGYAWECYLCHRCFKSVSALTQHANSPAHQDKAYHCPNKRCRREFVSLAALFGHLESETCGLMRFEQVQRSVKQVFSSNRSIKFG